MEDMDLLIERQRSKGHMKSYAYMTICGFVLIIGGGSFFLYESIITANDSRFVNEIAADVDELTVSCL